ncbi:MAG: hypothetical protein ACE15F_20295 [bacterium]
MSDEVRNQGWIVFSACSEKGDWDLFLMRPDGSCQINITSTPDYNEAAPQFSRDGRRLLYRRLARSQKIDGNNYGAQGELIIAAGDGSHPESFGGEGGFPWASWSPDGRQIACLAVQGIFWADVETKKILRRLDRKGFFQQLSWSPDGRWLCGVANNFGTGWSVARMHADTGETNPVSKVDCCTPDWFPDSQNIIFSNRPSGQKGNKGYGWTQLWRADAQGHERRLVFGEDGRHVYGGCVSPDETYVLFTGNRNEDGDPGNQGSPMGLMRLADAPIIQGESLELRAWHPNAHDGPVLALPAGWEPNWTSAEVTNMENSMNASPPASHDTTALARELHDQGWIVFSAETGRGDWDLYRMRPDGADRLPLTNTPDCNEAGARFSIDGQKMLFYRMPKDTPLDNNTYGTFTLIVCNSDGTQAQPLGTGYPWASWGPSTDQIACLTKKGIHIVNLNDKKIVKTIPRQGFVQQLGWSPDGKFFCGTANGLGPYWNIGCLQEETARLNAVSETERYNCTPDWHPDSRHILYSRGIIPDEKGWAELWLAETEGLNRRLLFAEADHHIYGGGFSPGGRYIIFTRSESDLGEVKHSKTRIGVLRAQDAPMAVGSDPRLRQRFPGASQGPWLDLGPGWEPVWTQALPAPASQ